MLRALTILFFSSTLIIAGGDLFAAAPQGASPKIKEKLVSADKELKAIEKMLAKLERADFVSDQDIETIDRAISEYAEAMQAAFARTMDETKAEASELKKPIELRSLKNLEQTAKNHEARSKKLDEKAFKVNLRIATGEAKLGREILQKLTPEQRAELKQQVTPKARESLEKEHPKLFTPGKSSAFDDALAYARPHMSVLARSVSPLAVELRDQLVPPAHALNGALVYGACAVLTPASGGAAVAACIGSVGIAGFQIADEWQRFKSCRESTPRWNVARRVGCWARFVAMLA